MNFLALLRQRRFLPLFVVQFGGALSDNVMRNALVAMITFGALGAEIENRALYVQLAVGFFMLPFFLFAASAGIFADRCPDRAVAMRFIKVGEIGTAAFAVLGLALGDVNLLLLAVFLAGVQSAFFGPFKYAVLPDLLQPEELPGGNALLSASTFLAIIAGVYAGTELGVRSDAGVAASLLVLAAAGFAAALLLPALPNARPLAWGKAFTWNIFAAIGANFRHCRAKPWTLSLLCIISWFWASGAIISTQLPLLVRDVFGYSHQAYLVMLLVICLGIATGSLLGGMLPRGSKGNRPVPLAIAVASVCCLLPVYPEAALPAVGADLPGVAAFFSEPSHYPAVINIFVLSAAMGLYIVPLYVTLQLFAAPGERGQVVAANNIFNALFIVIGVLLSSALVGAATNVGEGIESLYAVLGFVGFGFAVLANYVLPKIEVG